MPVFSLRKRFRGFLPVVIDVETAGFNPLTDALLELAAVFVDFDATGQLVVTDTVHYHITPFKGANLDPASLAFLGLDPHHPFRMAVSESQALSGLFEKTKEKIKQTHCSKAILVGHNSAFDLSFLQASVSREGIARIPFHQFSTFDTVTLSGLMYGQTVLAKALEAAKISFDPAQAHSALYDAQKTADLFCQIINQLANAVEVSEGLGKAPSPASGRGGV